MLWKARCAPSSIEVVSEGYQQLYTAGMLQPSTSSLATKGIPFASGSDAKGRDETLISDELGMRTEQPWLAHESANQDL